MRNLSVIGTCVSVVLLAALASVPAASAWPALAVKSGGLWYWSSDLAEGLYPDQQRTPGHVSNEPRIWALTNLTYSQKERLAAAAATTVTGTYRPDFKDGTVVQTWHCHGVGTSIASVRIDVDLYHRFSCTMTGKKYKRMGQFRTTIDKLLAQIKATPAPVPQSLIDSLLDAYHALRDYQWQGDPVRRTIPVVVTGRRAVALVGVFPV